MIVNNREKAWEEADKLFTTDYEKDYQASERAGYDVYRHNELNYYNRICDLGCRLEVIVDDVTTSIWIEEDKVNESVEAMHAAKELGESIYPLFEIESYQKITLCVDGSNWNKNETENKVYRGLKRGEKWHASDLVASYCNSQGIRWGVIEGININHYDHGNNGKYGGHFIITAYIGKRVEDK
jgi:hypothetical protein